MKTHTKTHIETAALEDEGFCLRCGEQQEIWNSPLGDPFPCQECGYPDIVKASRVLEVLALVEED